MKIYIVYEIHFWSFTLAADFALINSIFRFIKLTMNADPNKYKYSGYGIGFYLGGSFTFGIRFCKNVIIFGADMSLSMHINNS